MKVQKLFLLSIFSISLFLPSADKMNLLFVLVDDFGWKDVGYNGSTFYETPELDKLSKEFMKFDFCYTPSPMCSPTRISILTGKNPARHGVTQWLPGSDKWPRHPYEHKRVITPSPLVQGIQDKEETLAETLQNAGYETALYGKWHMGKLSHTGGPSRHGFEKEFAVIETNRCSMFYPFRNEKNFIPDAKKGDNFTDKLTDHAIKFIDQKRDKPFFLYLGHFAMHTPIASKPKLSKHFVEKLKDLNVKTKDTEILDSHAHKPYNIVQNSPGYAGELATLDMNVGRLINHLKAKGLYEKTMIIITGDNGGRTNSFNNNPPTSVYPLRGGKTFTFEGGLRTPLLVHIPGITKPGESSEVPVSSMDFYPTILETLGLSLKRKQHLDGRSFLPVIQGEDIAQKKLYWHFPHYQGEGSFPTSAMRKGKYKIIINYHLNKTLLFDISKDEGETNDLASVKPEKVSEMKKELMTYLNNTRAVIPMENPDFDPDK